MKQTMGEPARHFWMTRSVARMMGVSLSRAIQSQQLCPEEYSRMVTNCRACALVEACEEWLSRPQSLGAKTPPGCCNSESLLRLAGHR